MRKPKLTICLALVLAVAALSAVVISQTARAATSTNLEEALAIQRALAVERPADTAVLNDLGNLLALAGELEEAEATYRRAVELAPDRSAPRFNLALLLQQRGKREAAARELKQVVRLDPKNAWAHYQLGALQEAAGANDVAVRSYARAFELDPELSFPEVNPHVIENQLVLEAFMLAYRSDTESGAPRTFDEPQRIASLLAPVPPVFSGSEWKAASNPTNDEPVASDDEGEAVLRQPARFEKPIEDETLGEGVNAPVTQPRVLTEDDLRPGRVNQATSTGRAAGGQARGGQRNTSATDAARLRTWNRARYGNQQGGNQQGTAQTPAGGTPGASGSTGGGSAAAPPSVRTRYRPGLPSTGSLDTELIPDRPEKPAIG